ncbi:HEXXH motif domain-containing protein [Streptomyces jeddahensis]|uniref:HEXXH motif domain protein n=1 Tax=Streptomyces jeddahensis TaxID=1716141 RepID=A0A177HTQ0_9ACTN|nr:HEXXH motif domain-containing protein [Streptomyces jeddahensis]OAH13518.1 hypothetical protein STSP_31960 [Streptomyces jeddahensis]
MSNGISSPMLRELGRTEGGPETLRLLARDQDTRRFVLLRALLDAALDAPDDRCRPADRARLRDDWALLEAADRADRHAVREVLLHPTVGPWALDCLRALTGPGALTRPRPDLTHLGAVATAAGVRAGLDFSIRLKSRRGRVVLPTLGELRVASGSGTMTAVRVADGRVGAAGHGTGPGGPVWRPVQALPAVTGGRSPVLLDDVDPYRADLSPRADRPAALSLDEEDRQRWHATWDGVESLLHLGGRHRVDEAALLLRCLVPLARPLADRSGDGPAHCSGTRREAFGAVLSSTPPTAAFLAATLVHELQHTKLSALGVLTPLHTATDDCRYWAPWRPDARPFDGLLQGAYSHLALADFWQRYALAARGAAHRDPAWAEHARCREQVGAVLPVLAGSDALTPEGRVVVDEMISTYRRITDCPPPPGHLARARAYVATARLLWRQRNSTGTGASPL